MNLTVHMIVYNEENWIYYAINSILPYAEKLIIFDTGSTDKTVATIKLCKSPKIVFEEKGSADKKRMIGLRNAQIARTETDWFMILDGDEVYPDSTIKTICQTINRAPADLYGIYLRNHMCVGDVFHKMPERYGKYELCKERGHLNLRFYRKMSDWRWRGEYPLEYYGGMNGKTINKMCDKLQFVDGYYWHLSFLKRSSIEGRNNIKYHLGEKIKNELPKVFDGSVLPRRSIDYVARSLLDTPLRFFKAWMIKNWPQF